MQTTNMIHCDCFKVTPNSSLSKVGMMSHTHTHEYYAPERIREREVDTKRKGISILLWHSTLRMWHHHCCGSGSTISGLGTSICCRHGQKIKKQQKRKGTTYIILYTLQFLKKEKKNEKHLHMLLILRASDNVHFNTKRKAE